MLPPLALSISFWLAGFWTIAFAVSSEIPRLLNFSIALGTAGRAVAARNPRVVSRSQNRSQGIIENSPSCSKNCTDPKEFGSCHGDWIGCSTYRIKCRLLMIINTDLRVSDDDTTISILHLAGLKEVTATRIGIACLLELLFIGQELFIAYRCAILTIRTTNQVFPAIRI